MKAYYLFIILSLTTLSATQANELLFKPLDLSIKQNYPMLDSLKIYVKKGPTKSALEGAYKGGMNYYLQNHLFLNVTMDYLYKRYSFNYTGADSLVQRSSSTDGVRLGLGFGYDF